MDMKNRMSENSLISYAQNDFTGHKAKILKVMSNGYKIDAQTISDLTGIPLGTVTARINELRYEQGLVIKIGDTPKNRSIYRLRKEGEPKDERELSKSEKLLKELTELSKKMHHLKPVPGAVLLNLLDEIIENNK